MVQRILARNEGRADDNAETALARISNLNPNLNPYLDPNPNPNPNPNQALARITTYRESGEPTTA